MPGIIGEASVFNNRIDKVPTFTNITAVNAKELGVEITAARSARGIALHIWDRNTGEKPARFECAGTVIAHLNAMIANFRSSTTMDLTLAPIGTDPGPGATFIPA